MRICWGILLGASILASSEPGNIVFARSLEASVDRNQIIADLHEFRPKDEKRGIVVSLAGSRYFHFGVGLATRQARLRLERIAAVLKRHPGIRLSMEGYGDKAEAARYRDASLLRLSKARAIGAKEILVQSGVSADRIETEDRGSVRPLARGVDILFLLPRASRLRISDLIHPSGYVRNETAYRIKRPDDWTKTRNLLYLNGTGRLSENLSYKISGRMFYDPVYDLENHYPHAVEEDMEFQSDLRDTYLDVSQGNWDMRLGKQQVVWGEAVGVFVADVVNAKDLREFVLPDFDFIRIPQWAMEVERTQENTHVELLWIPVLEFNRLALPGSDFAPAVPLPAKVPVQLAGERKPGNSLGNSDVGARASALVRGWDLSLFYFYAWDRSPVIFRTGPASFPTLIPEHKRLPLTGATFSKEIREVVLKGEMVYSNGKYLSTLDTRIPDGVVKKDTLDYMLGADYSVGKKVDMNVQFLQRRIGGYGPVLFQEDPVRSYASLWLKTGFRDNTLEPEFLLVSRLGHKDVMVRPKINYSFMGNWRITLGMDLFEGAPDGLFGQYTGKGRVYTEIKYSF